LRGASTSAKDQRPCGALGSSRGADQRGRVGDRVCSFGRARGARECIRQLGSLSDLVYRHLVYALALVYPGAGRARKDRDSLSCWRAAVVEPWAAGPASTMVPSSAALVDSRLSLADLSARERTVRADPAPRTRIKGPRPDDRRPQLLGSAEARDTRQSPAPGRERPDAETNIRCF